MEIIELERRITELRARPLQLICMTPGGKQCVMTVRECMERGAQYLHVAADELDVLLGAELGGDSSAKSGKNRKFT